MEMLVLFLLGLATGVYGDCECQYPDQTYGQPPLNLTTLWIMNAYDTSTGQHCTKSCEIHLNSGNPALGIGDYTQYAWDSSVTGTIDIYNSNASWAQLTPFMPGIHQSYNPPPGFSTGQYLLVVVNTTGTGSVISSLSVGPAATQPPTDPPTTTTPTYTGPYAPLNPALISHDLVIMVDTGKNDPNTAADIKDSQTFTSALVEELSPSVFASPTSDQTRVTGTRLSLYQLNYLNSGPALIPWEVAAADVSNQIKNLFTVPSQRTPYTSAIKQFTDENSPFNVNLNKYQPSRNTAQRTLLVVSTSKPNDLDQLINVDLTTYDIRPLFVAFNFDPTDLDGLNKWTVVRADNTTDVISFVKQYFLSQGAGNHLCSQPPTLQYTASVTGDTFKWPLSFPDGFSSTSTPIYQKNRYCNFQKFSISITSHPDKATCFTVKHETEADKDTLKFYQQNGYSKWVEVVSLSGIDVDGTSFRIANDTRIEFETNESQVFGGFQIQFKICP